MISLSKFLIAKILKKLRLSSIRESTVHSTSKIESGSTIFHSCIDRYSFCGYDCDLYFAEIGSFTSIASEVVIGGARHPMEWVSMSPVFYKGRDSLRKKFSTHPLGSANITTIGHDVWIGRSAIVLSGVSIGNGAVIGAGAVVTKDIPPYTVAAGNPARIIRTRFDEEIINQLQETKWWELEDNEIHRLAEHIRNPYHFLSALHSLRSNKSPD